MQLPTHSRLCALRLYTLDVQGMLKKLLSAETDGLKMRRVL